MEVIRSYEENIIEPDVPNELIRDIWFNLGKASRVLI